jgi:hypothetical protein
MYTIVYICLAAAFPAWADERLPEDVARFIERRDGCDHFRGEEAYDEERRQFLLQKMIETCKGTDRQLAALKKKYRGQKQVMEKLSGYEPKIEIPQR